MGRGERRPGRSPARRCSASSAGCTTARTPWSPRWHPAWSFSTRCTREALLGLRGALDSGSYALRRALDRLRIRVVAEAEWRPVDPEGRFAVNVNRPRDIPRLN